MYNTGPQLPPDHPAILADIETQAVFMEPSATAESLRDDLAANRYAPVRWLLKSILEEQSIDPDTDEVAFRKFLRLAIQMAARAFDDAVQDLNGTAPIGLEQLLEAGRKGLSLVRSSPNEATQPVPADGVSPRSVPIRATCPPLSHFVNVFAKAEEAHIQGGTIGQKKASLNILIRTIGDIPADTITRKMAEDLRSTLERLPSSYGKSSRHAGMPIRQLLEKGPGENTLGISALDRHWRTIVAFFEWVNVQDDVQPINIERIFGQFRWDPKVRGEDDRKLWTSDMLIKLFTSPIFTGFSPDPRKRDLRSMPGRVVIKDEYWWLPILGIYHGARLEELCQLRGSDIKIGKDKIWHMDLHAAMKLKNKASKRRVPIHSAVIRLGLLALAERAGSNRLFPKLQAGGRDNKLGYEYSQEFTLYRRAIGAYEKLMDFHSFRHNVTTKLLREGKRSLLEIDELTGHDSSERKEFKEKQKSQSLDYFEGFDLATLKEAIETVSYPEIDIDALLRGSANSENDEIALAAKYPHVWGDKAARSSKRRTKEAPSHKLKVP
jgi:integrase